MKLIYCTFIANLMFISSFAQSNSQEISHYLFPQFTQGTVQMKSGIKQKTTLNYNSLTEEMVYEDLGKKLAIADESFNKIDTIFINNKRFIPIANKFLELIHHSKFNLFVEHKCKVTPPGKTTAFGGSSQTSTSIAVPSISYGGMRYELKLPDGFKVHPYIYYWVMKDGLSQRFTNLNQLKKIYRTKKDIFDKYVKQHDIKYKNQEDITQLVIYLESN